MGRQGCGLSWRPASACPIRVGAAPQSMTPDKDVSEGAGLCTPESPSLTSEGQAGITSQVRWLLFGQRQFSAEEGGRELWLPGRVPQPREQGSREGRPQHRGGGGAREAQEGASRCLPDLFQDGARVQCVSPSFAKRPHRRNRGAQQKLHRVSVPEGPGGGAALHHSLSSLPSFRHRGPDLPCLSQASESSRPLSTLRT